MGKENIKIGRLWNEFKKSPTGDCLLALVSEGPAFSIFTAGFVKGWRARRDWTKSKNKKGSK